MNLDGITGLYNTGSSCYLNSSLQCLLNDDEIIDELKNSDDQLSILLLALKSGSFSDVVNIRKYLMTKKSFFAELGQQDSDESLIALLELLQSQAHSQSLNCRNEINNNRNNPKRSRNSSINSSINSSLKLLHSSKRFPRNIIELANKNLIFELENFGNSPINNLFIGQSVATIICSECNKSRHRIETFNMLRIPIPNTKKVPKISDCFNEYTKYTILDGDEKAACEHCKKKTKTYKNMVILRFPKRLFISIRNNSSDVGKNVKIDDTLYFITSDGNHDYRLSVLVHHIGSETSGHYVTDIIKYSEANGCSSSWYRVDDASVSKCGPVEISNTAYMLIYELMNR
jgi:ubiquitin C-terminal hydrolase